MPDLSMSVEERDAFLAEPHIAVISVANDEGRPPHSVPVWYRHLPDGTFAFFTGTQGRVSRKTALIEQAKQVSVVVQREEFPYKYVAAECDLTRIDQPPTEEAVYEVVRRYLPDDHARGFAQGELTNASPNFVMFILTPTRWTSSDFGKLPG